MTWSTKMPKKPGGRYLVTVNGIVRQADLVVTLGGSRLEWLVLPERSINRNVIAWQRQPAPFQPLPEVTP